VGGSRYCWRGRGERGKKGGAFLPSRVIRRKKKNFISTSAGRGPEGEEGKGKGRTSAFTKVGKELGKKEKKKKEGKTAFHLLLDPWPGKKRGGGGEGRTSSIHHSEDIEGGKRI